MKINNYLWVLILFLVLKSSIVFANQLTTECDSLAQIIELLHQKPDNPDMTFEVIEQICHQTIDLACVDAIKAYNILGYQLYNRSNIVAAREVLLKAEELYLSDPSETNKKVYTLTQNYMGLVDILDNNVESALFHFNRSLNLAKACDDTIQIGYAYLNLGLGYLEDQNYEQAEKNLKKGLSFTEQLKNPACEGYANQNLARIFLTKQQFDEALHYIKKSKEIWTDLKFNKGLFLISCLEAQAFLTQKDYNNALKSLYDGRVAGEKAGMSLKLSDSYLIEASIFKETQQINKEINALEGSLKYGTELSIEDIQYITDRLNVLYPKSYSSDKNKLVANLLDVIQQYKLNSTISSKRIIVNEKRLDKEKEVNAQLQQSYFEGEILIKKQYLFIGILFSILLIASFLVTWIYRQTQKQEKLIKRLKHQKEVSQNLNTQLLASNETVASQLATLTQRNKELRDFAYVASHDLKSPLNTIKAFVKLLEKKLTQKEELSYLNLIQESCSHMTLMISDLLNHATTDQNLEFHKVHFHDLAERALLNLRNDINISQAQITIPSTDDAYIYCDATKTIQLLQNLINNAIIYSKENTPPIIEISIQQTDTHDIICVKDNGIGIEANYQEKIFRMFQRLKNKPDVKGTGIGLATCQKIVELHQGRIWVESEMGQGSRFFIAFPQKTSETLLPKKVEELN